MALQGFVESEYLAAKLAALQAAETEWVGKDTAFLKTVLANYGMTPEEHYQQYGWAEGLAPNNLFNATEYKLAKAQAMFDAGGYITLDAAQAAFDAAWPYDPYLHYVQYGSAEGVNPSNSFDESSYLDSKLAALQADSATSAEWTGKTAADLQAAFTAAGLTVLGHYLTYGAAEGIAVTVVPASEQVASSTTTTGNPGTTYTLTTAADNITGTDKDDVINGLIDQATPANSTINASDIIAGGSGNDTLSITGTGTTLDVLGSALVTGIETVNIRATTANSLNASQIAGLTAANANLGTGTVLVTNLATGASMGVVGNGTVVNGEVAFAYATATSTPTLNISGGTKMTAGITVKGSLGGGSDQTATSAVVNSTGSTANVVGTVDLANATLTSVAINADADLKGDFLSQTTDQVAATGAVTISGKATTVELTAALDNDIASIDASGMTAGGIIVQLGTLVTQTVKGGTGADRIKTGAVLTTGTVDGGAGTDTLEIGAAAHVATSALGAKYTNFETLRLNDSQDVSLVSGITAIELNAMTNKSVTNMTATQAANVKVLADQTTGVAFALANSSGTSDALNITAGTGLTTAATADLGTLTANGFESITITANPGASATVGTNKTTTIAALTADKLTSLTLKGTAFDITNAASTLATTIDASALTGDGTVAGSKGLTIAGTLIAGSTVTGSSLIDSATIAAEGSNYNLGAGNDAVSTTVAVLVADGTTDGTINGGDGTDTLTVSDAAATLTDNHFTTVSNMEKLTLSATGATSLTAGTAFNTAFSNGVTITQAGKADGSGLTYALGLSSVNTTIALTTAENGSDATATSITTGSGTDNVTVTASSFVSYAGGGATIDVSTGAGDDTISVTTGVLGDVAATSQAVTITGGTGADTITKVGTNGNDAETTASFVFAAGDSTTTAWDKITGYDLTASGDMADELDFAGTAAIGTLATSTDYNTILSHSISAGIASFDDAAAYATALVINSTNIADVVGYLAANTATNDVVAFLYDADGNGANDSTMVFHNGTTDSLVQLTGVTTADSVVTTNVNNGANDIFVL